jgi:uncharacterized protein (TIGR03437 family)
LHKSKILAVAALFAVVFCAAPAFAQTPANVAVVTGNGQIVCVNCFGSANGFFFQPLVVRVTDSGGRPVVGTTVSWLVTTSGFFGAFSDGTTNTTSVTDANGYASIRFNPTSQTFGTSSSLYQQLTITATAGSASATFTLTEGLPSNLFLAPITVTVTSDSRVFAPLTGEIGSTLSPPFKIQVADGFGNRIPNVSVMMSNDPTISSGTAECAAQAGAGINAVLTDSTGVASCSPVLGGTPNTAQQGLVSLTVGGSYPLERFSTNPTAQPLAFLTFPSSGPMGVQVTPGTPGSIRTVSGDGQSVQAGQSLNGPLVVQVQSASGNALGGQTVNWSVSPANAGTLGSASTTTDSTGSASNTLRLASTASGTVTVTASVAGTTLSPVTFSETAISNITVTGLSIVSGNNQTAIVNTQFTSPLVVQLTATGGSASNLPVTFSISGPATLSTTSVNTDSTGQAQVTVTAGSSSGSVTVTASASGVGSQTFNLTVAPAGPTLAANGFMNAADFQRGSLSPCSLATLFATGIAPGLQGMVTSGLFGPPPFLLGGDRLTVGGGAAPIVAVGRNTAGQEQLTFQVPCDVTPGSSVAVNVTVGSASPATVNIPVLPASPGIFQTTMSDGVTRAVVLRPDGSFVSLENPARRGEQLVAYVTGLGAPSVPLRTGGVAAPGTFVTPTGTVVVGMAGGGIPLVSAYLSDELIGVWLVTFAVPSSVSASNNVSFSISVIPAGGSTPISSGTTTIPVQ